MLKKKIQLLSLPLISNPINLYCFREGNKSINIGLTTKKTNISSLKFFLKKNPIY